ncbi:membrane-spanning 4-domains subfamily A member 8-like [Hydractinia symbiolongicarpus]|uniref:membrane-spanning 4-domains subfamily A member 8-like n=1 Tax=Hydractinia symbiolongicarpus TaxID=13093 RepID=UPI00255109CA|nr:membrane-spanning 4-domains subfamily A member 8-like [Hydractinia symbiolongicarpus]XP_057300005.1 membrane-spanning 4-domains subfamily A member 8-like [Hydractinia symbiolongicarpus]
MATQQPTIANSPVQSKRVKIISIFGIVLIIAGVLTLGFSASIYGVLHIEYAPINQHSTSLVASLWIIATGILGVCIHCKSNSRCLIGTFNAFVITASILAFGAAATSVAGVVNYAECKRYGYYNYYGDYYLCYESRDYGTAVYAVLLVLHLLEIAISITVTVFGFKAYNCCSHNPGQDSNIQMFQAAPQALILQTSPQQQYPMFQPQQNQMLVTSTSGQQFMLVPVTSQQTPIVSPVPLNNENVVTAPPYT